MNSLPVLLKNPDILLIGGGNVALEKAAVLHRNSISFRMISKEFKMNVVDFCSNYLEKEFSVSDINNCKFIIDATGCNKVRKLLLEEKRKNYFLLNRVDIPEDCDFYFSSLLNYKNLKIAISSDGASPRLTQLVRDRIKHFLPEQISDLASEKQKERIRNIIDTNSLERKINKIFGKVSLIGCGPGDPDLLTIKAYKTILSADVILYDKLISEEIIQLIPLKTEKIFVGKEYAVHSIKQEKINNLLLTLALKGKKVIRLKSGDPYIFGRGAEEAEFLIKNGIKVEVIPGITSAIAGPSAAGIPPTARNYSSNLTIVSGCLKDGKLNCDWISFLKNEFHTIIVLMGLHKAELITRKALELGIDKNKLVAIISNATTKKQKIVTTSLSELPTKASVAERPAILVFGKVVEYSDILPKYLHQTAISS